VAAAAGSDERNGGLPDISGKETLQRDPALAHRYTPHAPGFHRLDVVRDRPGVDIYERG
jgi:hypothetical protein